ncbi:DUF5786 family protein [Halomicrobium salinisoli]|uniref:DUF5786 family protein n=1 Tax=Halomicrobium salinisoli TaxID=2878391 RepID=UPI001CF0AB0B|nr:DUF5786 family protein [Halomicrobium salinisoli]
MGFGSYDESEQQTQEVDVSDDEDGVSVHQSDHDGEVTFEVDASTDDLIDKLQDIQDEDAS